MTAPAHQETPPDETTPVAPSRLGAPIACLVIFFALVDSQVLGAIAPQIAAGLGAAEATIAGGMTFYAIFAAGVALGLAWYPRAHHPRRWLPLAAGVFAIASLLSGLATHVGIFLAGRALAGLAGGLISALAIAAIANASRYEERGRQMGLVAVSYFLAPVVGVPLATILTGVGGWRVPFLLVAIAIAGAGLLVRAFPLPSVVDTDEPHALEGLRSRGFAGAVGTLWRLFARSRSTAMGIVSAAFVSGGLVGFTAFLGIWLANAFAAGPAGISAVYALAGGGAVAGGAIGGKLADSLGKRRVAVVASLAMAALLPLVASFAWSASLLALVAITAFAASLRIAPLQALITELVPPSERTTYIALRNASSQLGIAAAVVACGWAYGRLGMIGVALVCGALTVVSFLTIALIKEPHENAEATRRQRVAGVAGRLVGLVVALALLVPFVVLPFAMSVLVTKAGTRPDERNRPETPATFGADYVDVSFTSSDGNTLSGWYLPHRDVPVTIVMTHGMFRSRFELLERGVDLWKLGYGVLLYDLRRHGQSPAEFSTIGFRERHDVVGAADFVRERAPDTRVVLYGISMGAAATLLAARELDGISAIVVDSSFLSLDHTVSHHLARAKIPTIPFAPILVGLTTWRMGFDADEFDVKQAVASIDVPILFIGSSADDRMPVDTVLEPLYTAASSDRKRKLIIPDAGHGHAYAAAPTQYVDAVNVFLHDVLGTRVAA